MHPALSRSIGKMTRAEYRRWIEEQPERPRYELVAGEPVAMAPERVGHALLKTEIWAALKAEIRAKGLPCKALPDGITVEIGEDTDYEPDVVVNCGERLPIDAVAAPLPIIIVEVLSRSTGGRDKGAKLDDYFRLPSLRHYLLVKVERPSVIHHRRATPDGPIETTVSSSGSLILDPPGITIDIDAIYKEAMAA
jgi:Uma2 family endonuclease